MAKIVLASGSPRRQELLQRIGITDFDIRVPQTEETYPAGLSPRQTVEYISREKSDAAAALCTPEEIIITADTMVFLDGRRLGKPRDEADALRMLSALQGRHHTVCTGVTVRQGERLLTRAQSTQVWFREAATEELKHYIRRAHGQGRRLRRAGSRGAAGGAHRRRFLQRNGSAGAAAEPHAGGVRRDAAVTLLSLAPSERGLSPKVTEGENKRCAMQIQMDATAA